MSTESEENPSIITNAHFAARVAAQKKAAERISAYLGAELPQESRAVFDKIMAMRHEPPTGPLAVIANRDSLRWNSVAIFIERCCFDVSYGLSATLYNLQRFDDYCSWLKQQGPSVVEDLKDFRNSVVISPSCHKLIFEYEHFTFHLRATLDRLAYMLCYFFKSTVRNLKKLYIELKRGGVKSEQPEYTYANKFLNAYDRHAELMEELHSKDHGDPAEWTERDIIAHKSYLRFTQVNVQTWPNGDFTIMLVAHNGQELLDMDAKRLLRSRFSRLESFLVNLLKDFL